MAKLNFEQLGKTIDGLLKGLTLASKMGILAGGICILTYSLKIGHFPQGLTVGDGLVFMLAAVCFGMIYLVFVASLISLGVTGSPLVKLLSNTYLWTYRFRATKKPSRVYDFAKFKWLHLPFATVAILFIFALGTHDKNAYWNLPLLSVALYFFYSVYLSSGEKIKELEMSTESIFKVGEQDNIASNKIENLRKTQMGMLAVMLVTPMWLGGVTGQLLDGAMRQAHIRVENATVFIKEPYATLMPRSARSTAQPVPAQYERFEKISVLFKGLGATTVLSFLVDGKEKQLEVPNDQLIVD